jgi:hypothetical protein
MKAIDVLDSFIKFAQLNNDSGASIPEQASQQNVLQPQIISGQPPKRQANIPEGPTNPGGNDLYVRPNTNPQKFKI